MSQTSHEQLLDWKRACVIAREAGLSMAGDILDHIMPLYQSEQATEVVEGPVAREIAQTIDVEKAHQNIQPPVSNMESSTENIDSIRQAVNRSYEDA